MKICARCKQEKSLSEFYIKKNGKPHSWCDDCRTRIKKEWDIENKDHVIEYKKRTAEHKKLKDAEYREKNRDKLRDVSRVYNELLKERRKQDRLRPENKKREQERGRLWRKNNKEYIHAYFKEYYEKDEGKRIGRNLRHRLNRVLIGEISALHTRDIAGCTYDFLKHHIESQFTQGMSWSNYGKWHVDHIIPCIAFNFKNPLHQKACFYWRNLRPLWGVENIRKNGNYSIRDFDSYMDWFIKNVINK